MTELDEVIRKFWEVGYAGLDEREQRMIAYGYTVGSCPSVGVDIPGISRYTSSEPLNRRTE